MKEKGEKVYIRICERNGGCKFLPQVFTCASTQRAGGAFVHKARAMEARRFGRVCCRDDDHMLLLLLLMMMMMMMMDPLGLSSSS